MEKKSNRSGRSGMDPVVALTLVLVLLKVAGLISCSWLWVLSPIWLTFLFFAAISPPFWSADGLLKGNGNFHSFRYSTACLTFSPHTPFSSSKILLSCCKSYSIADFNLVRVQYAVPYLHFLCLQISL